MNKLLSVIIILNLLFTPLAAFADEPDYDLQNVSEKKAKFKLFKKKDKIEEEEKKREEKTFTFFKKREKKVVAEDEKITKEQPKEQSKEKPLKKTKKKEDKYSEYQIPLDGYMPVGSESDKTVTISGSVQKTLEFNLADCLELALINNPKVKAAYANAESVKYKKWQTLSNYSPRVDLQGGLSRVQPDMSTFKSRGMTVDPFTKYTLCSIGISQLIYDFGLTQNQYSIDKLNWEASKQNIESVVNEVVCQVKDGYYKLVYAIEARRVAEETFEHFEQMFLQAKAFYEVGVRPKVDVTIAEVNMEDARSNLITASNNVDIAISNLNNVMGLPFIPPYTIDTSAPFNEVDITMRKAVEIANEARPELKVAKLNADLAEQYVKLAKKTYFPSLEFSANWSIGGADHVSDTKWWDFGGFLTFPAINPFLIRNQIKEARALYEKQKYDSKATVNDIYLEIQSTYVKLVDAKDRIPVARLAVKKAKENYELSEGRYRVGVCDAIEYKEAQLQYYDSRLAYLNAIYQYNSARAFLEKAIGQTLPAVEGAVLNEGI